MTGLCNLGPRLLRGQLEVGAGDGVEDAVEEDRTGKTPDEIPGAEGVRAAAVGSTVAEETQAVMIVGNVGGTSRANRIRPHGRCRLRPLLSHGPPGNSALLTAMVWRSMRYRKMQVHGCLRRHNRNTITIMVHSNPSSSPLCSHISIRDLHRSLG